VTAHAIIPLSGQEVPDAEVVENLEDALHQLPSIATDVAEIMDQLQRTISNG
jgi:hypothetical protein